MTGRRTHATGNHGEVGFTLIELLVVIVILGILAGVAVFAVRGSGDKGKTNAIAIDKRIIRTAEEAYCAQKGRYADMGDVGVDGTLVGDKFLSARSTYNDVTAINDGTGSCNHWRYAIGPGSGTSGICLTGASGVINTIAGNGQAGLGGEGQQARAGPLNYPWGLVFDGAGNLYFSEAHRVRKIDSACIITTVAGGGSAGFTGDNGPATQATLYYPAGLAWSGGSLYIADQGNSRIRKIDPAGIITTVAGRVRCTASGQEVPTPPTGPPPAGVTCTSEGYRGDSGPATVAQLKFPSGVALDGAGNLYIADTDNNAVRKVDSGGTITTFVGGNSSYSQHSTCDETPGPAPELGAPSAVAVDQSGNLYIADYRNHAVRKRTPAGQFTTPMCEDSLAYPNGVELDGAGNLYAADSTDRVFKRRPTGDVSVFAGVLPGGFGGDGGPAASARLSVPRGLAVDSAGNLYIADSNNTRIRKVSE